MFGVCDDGVVYEFCGGDVLCCWGVGVLFGVGYGYWCSGISGCYCVWDCLVGVFVKFCYCVWNSCLGVFYWRYYYV